VAEVPLSPIEENLKSEAIHVYRSQLENEWLKGLFLSSIRTNELLIVPRNLYANDIYYVLKRTYKR